MIYFYMFIGSFTKKVRLASCRLRSREEFCRSLRNWDAIEVPRQCAIKTLSKDDFNSILKGGVVYSELKWPEKKSITHG
jgi:hypothetical protein